MPLPGAVTPKDAIIHSIEEDRGDVAFADDVHHVLRKLSQADLFVMQRAFAETFRLGRDAKPEDE